MLFIRSRPPSPVADGGNSGLDSAVLETVVGCGDVDLFSRRCGRGRVGSGLIMCLRRSGRFACPTDDYTPPRPSATHYIAMWHCASALQGPRQCRCAPERRLHMYFCASLNSAQLACSGGLLMAGLPQMQSIPTSALKAPSSSGVRHPLCGRLEHDSASAASLFSSIIPSWHSLHHTSFAR